MYYNNETPPELHQTEMLPLTEEQRTEYEALVREAVKNVYLTDNTLSSIISEEIEYYFEGEHSAEKTAEIIQNRAQIYLSEHYS